MNDLQLMGFVDKRGQYLGPVASLGSVIANMVRDLTEQTFKCPDYIGTKVFTSKRLDDLGDEGGPAVCCTCDEDELTWDHTDCLLHGDGNGNIMRER